MKNTYLLDTQIALWIFTNNKRLDSQAFKDKYSGCRLVFHQVSTWEIQIKYQLGKLQLPKKPKDFLAETISASGMSYEHIEDRAIYYLGQLPEIHRDPFDRLLISHALVNGWTVISADKTFEKYPVLLDAI